MVSNVLVKILYLIIFLVVTNCSTIKKYDFTGLSDSVVEEKIAGKRLDISVSQKELKVDKEASQLPIILDKP